jgi:putative Mg2+ transporter-C (MgtC) family protein
MESGLSIEIWLSRLVLAVVLGGIVGFERQYRGRPAGLRTHILVCLGATLVTLAGVCLVAGKQPAGEFIRSDPARVAAGVITGIGFLGGGAIIRTRSFVRGLTTAACIWFTAGLGVIIGYGFIMIAVAATIIELLTLIGLVYLEEMIRPFHYRDLQITAGSDSADIIEKTCVSILNEFNIRVNEVECDLAPATKQLKLVFHLQLRGAGIHKEVIRKLSLRPEISQISWRLASQQA